MSNFSNETLLHLMNDKIAYEGEPILSILHILLQVFLYSVGLFINIKLISVCNKEKGITWQISATHSAMMTIYYGYIIPFQAVTHFVPFLSQYTGRWLCYAASFVSFYCYHSIIAHSLIISIMKYVFIVHGIKAMQYGEDKLKKYFLLGNLINPLILTTVAMFTANLRSRSSLRSCFGDVEESFPHNNASSSGSGKFIFCTPSKTEDYNIVHFYVIQSLCLFRSIVNLITVCNLPEGFLYYKTFQKMKSQVQPSRDNLAANSLSEYRQVRNMKTVAVNTWVTLVVWVLESIANICIVVAWVFIYGSTSFSTLTNSMIWYYLILPYTFLMNTSFNKSRIVDDGWKTVFMNSVPSPCNYSLFRRNRCPQESEEKLGSSRRNAQSRRRQRLLGTSTPSMLSSRTTKRTSSDRKTSLLNEQIELSVISKREINLRPLKHNSSCKLGELEPIQSTSEKNKAIKKKLKCTNADEMSGSEPETESNNRSVRKPDRLRRGEELLNNMILHINDEDAYMHYFKQLIEFTHSTKSSETDNLQEFKIVPYIKVHTKQIYKTKTAKNTRKVKNGTISMKENSLKRKTLEEITLKPDFIIQLLDRIELRRVILDDFETYCCEDEVYDNFINRLIDFEESLIKD